MRVKRFSILLLCFCFGFLFVNNCPANLIAEINHTLEFNSVDSLINLSTALLKNNPDESYKLAEKAKDYAQQLKSDESIAKALWLMGKAKIELEDYYHAKKLLADAVLYCDTTNNEFLIAEIKYSQALTAYYNMEYKDAIDDYKFALKVYTKFKKRQDAANTLQNIGLVYHSLEDFDKAIDYYQKSLNVNKDLKNDTNIAGLYQNIGIINYRKEEFDKALDNYEKSISIFQLLHDTSGIATTFSNIGLIQLRQGNLDNAFRSFEKSNSIFKAINYKEGRIWALYNMGSTLMYKHDYTSARKYFDQSLQICNEILFTEGIISNYESISDLLYESGEYKTSLDYYKKFTNLRDSLQLAQSKQKINELEALNNIETKEKQLTESVAELKRQKTQKYAIIIILAVLAIASVSIYLAYKQKKNAESKLVEHRENLENIIIEKSIELKNEITERKIAEESDKLKSAFLANMSHELRTPMNAIIAFTNFLHDPDLTEDKKNEYLEHIGNAGETLLRLIDDIIDIAKIESRQIKIHITPTNISRLIRDIFKIFSELRIKNNYSPTISLQLSSQHDIIINTDALRLKQILSNLIDNAFKYTKEGNIEFGLVESENELVFYVKDTGIGIPQDKQEKIFERFSQLEYSLDRKFGGTGLGLAISKNLTELLGGRITVVSELDKGSTFFVKIPAKELRRVEVSKDLTSFGSPLKSKDFNWESKTILIAEDEELNYKVLDSFLAKTRARLLRAHDGESAIRIFKNEKVDLVLMDIQMPMMDGYKATSEIKKINNNTPVIAQTSFVMANEKEKCIVAGCDDYISKPLNLEDLLIKINKYLT
jgi:signal transduction histidine kinase/Tfp pilus assembly protein PilF